MSKIQTTNITDTSKLLLLGSKQQDKLGSKSVVAREKEAKDLSGKGESTTLLQSYGGMLTSWKVLIKGNLKGRKNTASWKGSITSNRKERSCNGRT